LCEEASEDWAEGVERLDGVESKEDSVAIDDAGEKGRGEVLRGGGVHSVRFRSSSKGELLGEDEGLSLKGKVGARGVGEMMANVGVSSSGASVVTSSAIIGLQWCRECGMQA